jgi:hypothetical protein
LTVFNTGNILGFKKIKKKRWVVRARGREFSLVWWSDRPDLMLVTLDQAKVIASAANERDAL